MPSDLQFERLKEELNYVYEYSRFYKRKFRDVNIHPKDVKTLEDFIERIPFTTKTDLRMHNDDFICVPKKQIVDFGATTGTTGTPVFIPMTKRDWGTLIESIMHAFVGLGMRASDVFQISAAFDQLFSLGTPYDDAAKKLGITVLRMGPGNLRRQVEIMKRLKTTVVCSTPEFMLLLAEEAKKMGLNPQMDFKLRMGIFFGQSLHTEDWQPNALNRQIREKWGIEVYSDYGSMEMTAGFFECKEHGGHHIPSDHFFVEIVDPETGLPVPLGEPGELVFTHLTREGMPLIRFRQGDVTRLETNKCICGRTTPRIMSIIGRVDDMMKIKGISLYPGQIEEALLGIPGVIAYVIEACTDSNGIDRIIIKVAFEGSRDIVFEGVEKAIKAKARVTPDAIKPISKAEAVKVWFSDGTRKPKRFWDRRKK